MLSTNNVTMLICGFNNDFLWVYITEKLKAFYKMSKQGIVDTSITLKILQYQIYPNNPQGLHTFAVKIPHFGEKFITNFASGYSKLSKQGIITTLNSSQKSLKKFQNVANCRTTYEKCDIGQTPEVMETNPLKMKPYELQ